jgi:5-(carboxyamino)imidazole ribonucleotide mutase
MTHSHPHIGIVMGSDSDWATMKAAADICDQFGIAYEKRVVSAHRTPDDMAEYGRSAQSRGLKVIIAGAGGAAHLPGMLASHTLLPVIGVPVMTKSMNGLDSLLSIVQMPKGIPVATVAIDNATNASLLALRILALEDQSLMKRLADWKEEVAEESRKKTENLES